MVDKLHDYQGVVGRLHTWQESARAHWCEWRERKCQQGESFPLSLLNRKKPPKQVQDKLQEEDYSHIYRTKTRRELVRISAAVMGIEFSYAAETAFVSPILLKIGVTHEHMTLVWGLSPLVGFFLTPLLGSLSDRCHLPWGRRRPFILILSLGILLGLLLVPNGMDLGYALGDYYPSREHVNNTDKPDADYPHPWSVFFTVMGTVLLDFDADACQSPARAYLLDVTIPEDHARGLSTFTIMAGLGGFMGYALGAINWDATALGMMLGGHVKAVFTLITFMFTICVAFTITSFKEIPLQLLEQTQQQTAMVEDGGLTSTDAPPVSYGAVDSTETQPPSYTAVDTMDANLESYRLVANTESYGTVGGTDIQEAEKSDGYVNYGYEDSYLQQGRVTETEPGMKDEALPTATLLQYLKSIVHMPRSLQILCVTNLFCWSAHVCYSLYFTDFVGQAVFKGNPKANEGTYPRELYEEGVRFGCWGMSMYSLSCACYSLIIERLIKRFKARNVYVCGLLVDALGMLMLAITKHHFAVIIFSAAAGVMYSTLFTMPYLLVAHYHETGTFEMSSDGVAVQETQIRGLGTDVAIVSSMVFIAQFALSMSMGSLVKYFETTTTVVSVAAVLCTFGALSATQVTYLDL